ncbi:MAG: tetratricopeptide repeat protein [Candidatus Hodarchaeota archaeon]
MADLIDERLERGWDLLNEGKLEEALKLISEIEKKEEINPEEKLRILTLKGIISFFAGNFVDVLNLVEYLYKESIRLKKPFDLAQSILLKFGTLAFFTAEVSWKDIEKAEQILKSITQELSSEIEETEALLLNLKGWMYYMEQEFDLALELFNKSYSLFEHYNRWTFMLDWQSRLIAATYLEKGELNLALDYLNRFMERTKGGSLGIKRNSGGGFSLMGSVYYQKGDFDLAIEYVKKGLAIYEELNGHITGRIYATLINIFMDKNSLKQAQEYLDRLYQYNEKNKQPVSIGFYQLSKARLLKSSTRTRDKANAETILKDIIDKYEGVIKIGGSQFLFTDAIAEICDLYIEELRTTDNLEIVDDLQPYLTRLLKESERTKSYLQQAHVNLLQGQLALLQINLGDARRYLTVAQKIADEHGLQLLAQAISNEHDILLEQLEKWENLEKQEAPISERLNLISLNETIDLMLRKRAIEPPEPEYEQSLVLLIIAEGGILIFSYHFTKEWKFNDELFGGFLTAFNSISDEIFSKGLDRVKIGEHTVLVIPLANFSICYLFKGQSYYAKQKLNNFAEYLQKNDSIQQILDKCYNTGQILELKDFPFLESLITEVFKHKSSELIS